MANEGPNIHDGAQCVSGSNFTNTAALAGPSGSGQFLGVILSQSVDRTVTLAGLGNQIYGVLQNKPASGAAADVVIFGITKAVAAAAAVTRGKPQMTTATGAFTDWVSGASRAQVGYALESAVSGQVFTMFMGATSPVVLT